MMKFMNALLFMIVAGFAANFVADSTEAQNLAPNFNFDGVLVDNSNVPLPGPVSLQFDIYNPGENCLLYRETQTGVVLDAAGAFSVKVGAGTRDTAADGGGAFHLIFQNAMQPRAAGTNCSTPYTPASGDGRRMRVTVNGTALTPSYALSPAPFALVAQTLNGRPASDFLLANPTTPQTLRFTNGSNSLSFVAPGSIPGNVTWTLPPTDGSAGQTLMTNGSGTLSWFTPAAPGSSITALNGLTGSVQTLDMGTAGLAPAWNSSGSIHTLNIPMASGAGVTAGLLSKTDYDMFNAKLSNVSGSALTNGEFWVGNVLGQAAPVTMSGDATMSSSGMLNLAPTGVTVGTYTKFTVDNKGRVTNGMMLGPSDIPPMNHLELVPQVLPGGANPGTLVADMSDSNKLKYWDGGMWRSPGGEGDVMNNGNSFGMPMMLGTNDSFPLRFRTNGAVRVAIDQAGLVGIGTTIPNAMLQVQANPSYNAFVISRNTSSYSATTSYGSAAPSAGQPMWSAGLQPSAYSYQINSYDGSVFTPRMVIDPNGNVGVGTLAPAYKMDIVGDLQITGTPYRTGGDVAWTVPSDQRLKDVAGSLEYGLEEISKIDTVRFHYKKDNPVKADSSKEYTGVLAQQVQALIPEAVEQRGEYLTLNTTPIFWSMVNAIKELKGRVEKAEAENKAIRAYLCSKDPEAPICK